MKAPKIILGTGVIVASLLWLAGCKKDIQGDTLAPASLEEKLGAKPVNGEAVGNNLSFPVIWSEGTVGLTLRGTYGAPSLRGEWWWVWGTADPIDPAAALPGQYSCEPVDTAESPTCLNPDYLVGNPFYKAWLQKDPLNDWQAYSATFTAAQTDGVVSTALTNLAVDSIDWGDNLESVSWYLVSKVRTEVVLYKNLLAPSPNPVIQYPMRWVSGWGTDEVHGLQTNVDGTIYSPTDDPTFGTQATVYSAHARLTIQRINTTNLTWSKDSAQWTSSVPGEVGDPVFTGAVYEAGDGPGFYNAEINVKGKVIYGYTWDVKRANDGAGTYRITFSFDEDPATVGTTLNTYFVEGITGIIQPSAEEEIIAAAKASKIEPAVEPGQGGTAVLSTENNLTYIDVYIGPRGGGGGRKPIK